MFTIEKLFGIFSPVAAILENEKTLGTRLFLRMSSWSGYSVVIFLQLNNNSNNKQNKTTHVKHQANSFIFCLLKGFPHFLKVLFLSFLVSCSKLWVS